MFTVQTHYSHKNSYANISAVCNGCKQKARDEKKSERRALNKARNTFYTHADKYIEKGFAKDREDFAKKFRWDVHQMAHDIEHTYENGCPYCRKLFIDMPHELMNVTLDIVDPDKAPYYQINTNWCCMTCNREKSKTHPDLWGTKLRAYEKWEKQQEKLKINPYAGSPLFESTRG